MAQLAIKKTDNFHPEYAANFQYKVSYMAGDVVEVFEDSEQFSAITLQSFDIVSVAGKKADWAHLDVAHETDIKVPVSMRGNGHIFHLMTKNAKRDSIGRRRWKYNSNTLQLESKINV